MLARRLLAVIAFLMAVTLLAAMLAPVPRTSTPSTGGVEAPAQASDPTVEITLDASDGERIAEVGQDDVVHLVVKADALDTVELHGLDMMQSVARDSPAVFDLLADSPGDYPIVLLDAGRTIGTLRVSGPQR